MKGVSEGILGYIVIILSVITLIFFLYSQGELKGIEVSKQVHGRVFDEEARLSTIALFNNKVDFVEKPYIETMIDAALSRNATDNVTESYKAFYGIGIGTLNNTEIIPPLYDNYIQGKWRLILLIPNGTKEIYDEQTSTVYRQQTYLVVSYGNLSDEPRYTYKQMIPVPEQRTGKLILYIG